MIVEKTDMIWNKYIQGYVGGKYFLTKSENLWWRLYSNGHAIDSDQYMNDIAERNNLILKGGE
jgi:hypothetical protein